MPRASSLPTALCLVCIATAFFFLLNRVLNCRSWLLMWASVDSHTPYFWFKGCHSIIILTTIWLLYIIMYIILFGKWDYCRASNFILNSRFRPNTVPFLWRRFWIVSIHYFDFSSFYFQIGGWGSYRVVSVGAATSVSMVSHMHWIIVVYSELFVVIVYFLLVSEYLSFEMLVVTMICNWDTVSSSLLNQ